MLKGRYIREDGLILPNNVTIAGAQWLLAAALQDVYAAVYMGLVVGFPSDTLLESGLAEPTIGTNGYARQLIARSNVGWPNTGVSGNEAWISTTMKDFTPSGGNFDKTIQRVALFLDSTYTPSAAVLSLSAPLPAPVILTPTTPSGQTHFQYQLYI